MSASYYQGRTIQITNDMVEIWWPDHQRFALADIDDVSMCRGPADPAAVRSIGAAGMAVLVFVGSWAFLHSPGAIAIGVVIAVAAIAHGSSTFQLYPPPFELHALYQGRPVCLWYTRDALVFGQVKRALVRALEAVED
jgi:hypothetical protein